MLLIVTEYMFIKINPSQHERTKDIENSTGKSGKTFSLSLCNDTKNRKDINEKISIEIFRRVIFPE